MWAKVGHRLDGRETVTELRYPNGISINDAVVSTTHALAAHVRTEPVWIECDNKTLLRRLVDHYGIGPRKNVRPVDWGQARESAPREEAS